MSAHLNESIYRRILKISLPLVASLGATTVMEFTDRLFLSRYSLDAIAAATPAGIAVLLAMTVFFGTANYVSVFVAQYVGQGRPEMSGSVVWQGLYVALLGTFAMAALATAADDLFRFVGHAPAVQELEAAYFRTLSFGASANLIGAALSGFFIGIGCTRVVMIANLTGMCLNIPLDYCLINGIGPFPEWGIVGAGVATVMAWGVTTLMLLLGLRQFRHDRYGLRRNWQFRFPQWLRLVQYGLPSAMEIFLDIFGFTVFVFVVGRLGTVELAATNIALNINSLAFMPLVGFGLGTSTLTGQAMGAGQVDDVSRIVRASLVLSFAYLAVLSGIFLLQASDIIALFQPADMDAASFAEIIDTGRILLSIVVAYLFFDGVSFIVYGALKGAGDTLFVMLSRLALVFGIMILPLLLGVRFGFGLYYCWGTAWVFVVVLSFVGWWRFAQGRWRDMLVVEK